MKPTKLLLSVLMVLLPFNALFANTYSGKIGDRINITLSPQTNGTHPDLLKSSCKWSVASGNSSAISLTGVQDKAIVDILSYFSGTITIRCQYQIWNSSKLTSSYENKTAYYYITCSSPDPNGGGNGGGGGGDNGGNGGGNDGNSDYYVKLRSIEGHQIWCCVSKLYNEPAGIICSNSDKSCVPQSTEGRVTIPAYTEDNIPIRRINNASFYSVYGLTEIVIPNTLESIDSYATLDCPGVEKIICLATTPPKSLDRNGVIFGYEVFSGATLYVPYGCKQIYINAAGWSKFKKIEELGEPEIDVNISSTGYATFYSSKSAYALPDGLSAQVVTNVSNDKLSYQTIANGSNGGIIPKGTAVILTSNDRQSGIYKLVLSDYTTTYSGINLLQGSDEATKTSGTGYHYKLSFGKSNSDQKNVFGWYWGAEDGGSFHIEGRKAWLVVPKSSNAPTRGFSVEGKSKR